MMLSNKEQISIAVVDDHQLFREGIIALIQRLNESFKVTLEMQNGKELMDKLHVHNLPDLLLLDLSMPIMDGLQTLEAVRKEFPKQKCLILTMKDDEMTLIQLLKAGANGFLSKDVEQEELEKAILTIHESGYYYSEYIAGKLVGALKQPKPKEVTKSKLNDQELKFIELACSENTYQMIADKMFLSVKTIDGYRAKLFEKLEVKSRVGLVLYALKHKIVSIDS